MSNLQTLVFYATPEHDCSYLPGKKATTMFVDPKANLGTHTYSQLSQLGFRRSGNHYYRPHCNDCQACIPVRIPVNQFQPNRSQRRVLNKNKDIQVRMMKPDFHEDHYQLYEKYINHRHADGDMYPASRDQYRSFLVESHSSTRFLEFSVEEHLLAIAVMDDLEDGFSAIYTFFDPEETARSPGTLAVLWQIQEARRIGKDYVYLGYFIRACQKMSYKTRFRPFEARINDFWMSEQALESILEQL